MTVSPVRVQILFLVAFLLFSDPASASFAQKDLTGSWAGIGQEFTGDSRSGIGYGSMIIDEAGIPSGAYSPIVGPERTVTGGSLSITKTGEISGEIASSTGAILTIAYGTMNTGKTKMMYVGTTQNGYSVIQWLYRQGERFDSGDLIGVWKGVGEDFTDQSTFDGLGYGILEVKHPDDLLGVYKPLAEDHNYITAGSRLAISGNGDMSGVLYSPGNTLTINYGIMNGDKTELMFIGTTQNGYAAIRWLFKSADEYAPFNLTGTWSGAGQEFTPGNLLNGIGYGSMTVDHSGIPGGTYQPIVGEVRAVEGGHLSLTDTGEVVGSIASSTGATLTITFGLMDASKTQIVYVGTTQNGYMVIQWLQKRAPAFPWLIFRPAIRQGITHPLP